MKRSTVAGFIAALSLVHSVSYAQLIVDLPDPTDSSGGGQTQSSGGSNTSAPSQAVHAGSVIIPSISRKTGGELYRVTVNNPQTIRRLDLRVMSNRLKIHKATVIKIDNQRYDIPTLNNLNILEVDSVTNSGDFGFETEVKEIELQLESFGGPSQLVITALGAVSIPDMSATMVQQLAPDMSGLSGDNGGTGAVGGLDGYNYGQPPITPPPPVDGLTYDGKCTFSGICKGDRIGYGDALGMVKDLMTNGQILIVLDHNRQNLFVKALQISRIVSCLPSGDCFQYNQRVAYMGKNVGNVMASTENGKVYIKDATDGYMRAINSDQVAVKTRCMGPVCLGDRGFLNGNTRTRLEVVEVFTNGTMVCRVNGKKNSLLIVTPFEFYR